MNTVLKKFLLVDTAFFVDFIPIYSARPLLLIPKCSIFEYYFSLYCTTFVYSDRVRIMV